VAYFGDWFATAAELAGANTPAGLDSISFAATLAGRAREQKPHEFLYWEFHERGFHQAALYQGRWKGIRAGSLDAPLALHDLQHDVAEKANVASAHPAIVAKIAAYLKSARTDSADWVPAAAPARK
jgi:arylsulfatase A-like enzyme